MGNNDHVKSSILSSSMIYASSSDSDKDEGESQFDVEAARKQLESQLNKTDTEPDSSSPPCSSTWLFESLLSSIKDDKVVIPPPPPLSTIERDRRHIEIQLLKALKEGDEASSSLWTLWYSERGASAKLKLEKADALMGDPENWPECEKTLKELIDEYGIYFVEPLNRLATLHFMQSKLESSYNLCLIILKIKPWHVGALSGIVQVCIGRADRNAARLWAEKRLPTVVAGTSFPPFSLDGPVNPRREQWVDEQVAQAEKVLRKAEKDTKKSFGEPDSYYRRGNVVSNEPNAEENNDNTWQ
jgi:hypothetical protein